MLDASAGSPQGSADDAVFELGTRCSARLGPTLLLADVWDRAPYGWAEPVAGGTLAARVAALATWFAYIVGADETTVHGILQQMVEKDYREASTVTGRVAAFQLFAFEGLSRGGIATVGYGEPEAV